MALAAQSPSSQLLKGAVQGPGSSGAMSPLPWVLRGTWKQDYLLGVCGGVPGTWNTGGIARDVKAGLARNDLGGG